MPKKFAYISLIRLIIERYYQDSLFRVLKLAELKTIFRIDVCVLEIQV